MSRMILDQNNSHKRATIANVYASTPVNALRRHFSVSLSGIDTGSSSSGGRITRNLQLQLQDLAKKRETQTKKKKREDTSRIDSDSEWEAEQKRKINKFLNEKRKKNLNNEERAIKRKRIVTPTKYTDSEWETESEKSITNLSVSSRSSILNDAECIKLFEDPCATPERTRDISAYDKILPASPDILEPSRKRLHLISKTKNIALPNELLPVNLLSTEVQNPEEIDENETIFDHKGNTKTHAPLRKPVKSLEQRPENLRSSDLQFPTILNSLRRNQPDKTYSRKSSQNLASSFVRLPMKYTDFIRSLPRKIPRKIESTIPPGMTCVSGSWNKASRKWIRTMDRSSSSEVDLKNNERKMKTSKRNTRKQKRKMISSQSISKEKPNIYDRYDETDTEFETGGLNGARMSLSEFRRKHKDRNQRLK